MRYLYDSYGWYSGTTLLDVERSTLVAPMAAVGNKRPCFTGLTGHEWTLVEYVEPAVQVRPRLVITNIVADAVHAAMTNIAPDFSEIYWCPEGTTLTVTAEIRDDEDAVLPVTAVFRMPVRSRSGGEFLVLVPFVNGIAAFDVTFKDSGLWFVTEGMVNESLSPDQWFRFLGIDIPVAQAA